MLLVIPLKLLPRLKKLNQRREIFFQLLRLARVFFFSFFFRKHERRQSIHNLIFHLLMEFRRLLQNIFDSDPSSVSICDC